MVPQEISKQLTSMKGRQFKYDGRLHSVQNVIIDNDQRSFKIVTDHTNFNRKFSAAEVFFESITILNGHSSESERINGAKKPSAVPASSIEHQPSSVVVYSTTDYSRFKMINGNRAINQHKAKRIIKEIEAGNDMLRYYPIQVKENNERLDILDGQHRFYIDQKLRRPVYYILVEEEKNMPDIAKVNSNVEKWTSNDYINCYIQQGNLHYKELKKFMETYDFPATTALRLLNKGEIGIDGSNVTLMEAFKYGAFEIRFADVAYEIAENVKSFSNYKGWTERSFIVAIYRIKKAGLIPIDDILAAFKKRPEMLTPQKTYKEYIWNLEQIVNVGKHSRVVIV